jgi:membrane protein
MTGADPDDGQARIAASAGPWQPRGRCHGPAYAQAAWPGRNRRRANEFKLITDLDDRRRKDAGVSASDKTALRRPASGPGQRPETRPTGTTAVGWPGVRRALQAAQWGKKKYAGSLAEDVRRRLDTMDFINRGMVFAATLLLCLFPFLIVVSALAGRSAAESLTRYTGLNSQAAADIGHLFASSAATTSAVVGTVSMVFFVFGGIAAAAALQEIYEQVFDLPHRRIRDLPHRLAWLAVLIGASLLSGWAGPWLRHVGGPALLAVAGLAWATGFWWLTMRILLAGRISRRALFPAACATGVLYVAMQTVFSLVFSAMVISNEHTYGPIGTIFALLSYLIAIGVVVILGAVAGRAWHERSPGTSKTGQLPALPSSVATSCACPGVEDGHIPLLIQGRLPVPSTKTHGAPATARCWRGSEVSPPPSDVQAPGCRPARATGCATARCPYCARTA